MQTNLMPKGFEISMSCYKQQINQFPEEYFLPVN